MNMQKDNQAISRQRQKQQFRRNANVKKTGKVNLKRRLNSCLLRVKKFFLRQLRLFIERGQSLPVKQKKGCPLPDSLFV